MLKWLIRRRLAAFERDFDYDVTYVRSLLDTDLAAFRKFAAVSGMAHYRRDVPRDVCCAAGLTASMAEDCGPCTQLGVTMALRDGVKPETIAAVLSKDTERMSDEVRLGVAFAQAVLARDPSLDEYREEIVKRWGPRALVSLAFAITGARMFPTVKYALGYGKSCQKVVVAGQTVPVARHATNELRASA